MTQSALSQELYHSAKKLMPGGVSSPVRSFHAVGGDPFFVEKAKGAHLTDADGNTYIDYVMSYGPLILGHAHEEVLAKISNNLVRGLSYGAPHGLEVELAKMVTDRLPSMDMIRFVNSGTEATMSVIRLARGIKRRDKIVKFHGNYHGHGDSFLVQAGSGVAQHGIPGSPGVPHDIVQNTIGVPYNDLEALQSTLQSQAKDIAAIIMEPVCGNMGVVLPEQGYLQAIRDLCTEHDVLLIFDEVMTGFRLDRGGAQTLFGIEPDLTCLGKIIGGGMPVGAYGGKRALMEHVAPTGPVYQAGTLSGNPVCMASGIKTLKVLDQLQCYETLALRTKFLADQMIKLAAKHDVKLTVNQIGSMMTPFFTDTKVNHFEDAKATDHEMFKTFFHHLLDQGVFIPPSPYEAWFLSIAHTQDVIQDTLKAVEYAFEKM